MVYAPPPALKTGDTIHVVAPASKIVPARFATGCDFLQRRGYRLEVHDQVYLTDRQSAGPIIAKAQALADVLPQSHFVWAACGGNRTAHTLPHLAHIDIHPHAAVIGFSDITMLQADLYRKQNQPSFFAPTVQRLATLNPNDVDYTLALLSGQISDYPMDDAEVLREGTASAPVYVATLSILAAMCGTPYMPDLRGHILMLEDTNEEASRIDRMLWQLAQTIPFYELAGLVLGSFDPIPDTGSAFGFTLADLALEHTADSTYPVVINAPFGHGSRMQAVANGASMTLNAGASRAEMRYNHAVVQLRP